MSKENSLENQLRVQQLALPLCNEPAREAQTVVQRAGSGFTFYATFDVDSLCSYIPEKTAILLPASSWARKNLSRPRIPAHITDTGADSGGFVASRIWGDYRYSLEQYIAWLQTWSPRWAACMDYCCEPELAQVTRDRQEKTTANVRAAWSRYPRAPFAWVPTVQGWTPDDYRQHAGELQPIIEEMRAYYRDNPAWRVGVGTLCHRENVTAIQAILNVVREVLPGVPLHLWGIKLDALRSIDLDQVISTDSAVWHGGMYAGDEIREAAHAHGMSIRAYKIKVNLPTYSARVYAAVDESRRVCAAQQDTVLLSQARAVLKAQGWTINIRTRRNRRYVYAARRRGQYIEQRSICPVSGLKDWLAGLHHCTTVLPGRRVV